MKKYRVGFICGFFDIIHEGHIEILSKAKSMCDFLIVAVGTDEFMQVRKNRMSVLSYEERVIIVKAIRYVDQVVPEEDLDKVAAYKKYHFDVMFAGDDHMGELAYQQVEKELLGYGVDTIYIPRINSMSSTYLRNRVKEISDF